jgi:hypothetical protein
MAAKKESSFNSRRETIMSRPPKVTFPPLTRTKKEKNKPHKNIFVFYCLLMCASFRKVFQGISCAMRLFAMIMVVNPTRVTRIKFVCDRNKTMSPHLTDPVNFTYKPMASDSNKLPKQYKITKKQEKKIHHIT